MKTITVARFSHRADAEQVKQKLLEVQIPAEIHGDFSTRRLWFGAGPFGGVNLDVPSQDYQEAKSLLRVWDTPEGVMHTALHCPECGSTRIEYPQYTRKFILPNVIGLLSAAGLLEKDYYCLDCQHVWPPPGRKAPRMRAHMAPNYFIEGVEESDEHPKSRN